MEGTEGTQRAKGRGGMYGVDLARGKDRSLTVILCGDEFCINVARYRLADQRQTSLPPFLCEKCYEALSDAEKTVYKEREMPIMLNNRRALG